MIPFLPLRRILSLSQFHFVPSFLCNGQDVVTLWQVAAFRRPAFQRPFFAVTPHLWQKQKYRRHFIIPDPLFSLPSHYSLFSLTPSDFGAHAWPSWAIFAVSRTGVCLCVKKLSLFSFASFCIFSPFRIKLFSKDSFLVD